MPRSALLLLGIAVAGEHRRHRVVGRGESRQTTVRPVSSFHLPAVALTGDSVELGASPLAVPDALSAAIDIALAACRPARRPALS
jgi:hypothetical protein